MAVGEAEPEEGVLDADNRIRAGASDTTRFRFAWRGAATRIEVRVVHRLRFKAQWDALLESDPEVDPAALETEGDILTLDVPAE